MQRIVRHGLGVGLVLAALSGCASLSSVPSNAPAQPDMGMLARAQQQRAQHVALTHWSLRGSVALQEGERHTSARLFWEQQGPQHLELRIQGGLGAGALRLVVMPESSTLWAEGEELQAASPEALLQQRAGMDWPISALVDWIRGLPQTARPLVAVRHDTQGHMQGFEQDGWQIEIVQRDERSALPRRLRLQRVATTEEFVLEFAGLHWQLDPPVPSSIP